MEFDAIVIGSGPNGLAAAIEMARAGLSVCVYEMCSTVGGGTRTEQLTLPGFLHDVCSAVHPLAAASPFFRSLPLHDFGLKWIHPHAPLVHPLAGERGVVVERSVEKTARELGSDAKAYVSLIAGFVDRWKELMAEILAPLHFPRHPALLSHFGWNALKSARSLAFRKFSGKNTRALIAGMAAHSLLPLERSPSGAFFLIMSILAHAVGWPIARGGSQRIADALADYLKTNGGRIITNAEVRSLQELPHSRVVLCDVTPQQLIGLAKDWLPDRYRKQLQQYKHGPGVFKIDWALSAPIPWGDPRCSLSATLHIGGTFEEIAESERSVTAAQHPNRPFVLLAQPSLFDSSRAPAGLHTAWAYCHVPNGSAKDMTAEIEKQIEDVAEGFSDCILARHTRTAREMEAYNPNYVGGDIAAGAHSLKQILSRPIPSASPYRTPVKGLYLCSAATPPGAGVHGMCGYYAARTALEDLGMTSKTFWGE
jgi:phytoene dehydrogenase-like protein